MAAQAGFLNNGVVPFTKLKEVEKENANKKFGDPERTEVPLLKCSTKRLVLGLVKVGKTWGEIVRLHSSRKEQLSIIVTLFLTSTSNQTKEQALEIGWPEKDIITTKYLKKSKADYSNLRGKLLIVNLHENYEVGVLGAISKAHSQGMKIDFILDEYDQVCPFFEMNKHMPRWEAVTSWLNELREGDSATFVSATNVVAYLSREPFEIVRVEAYKNNYFGYTDIIIQTISDLESEDLDNGKMPLSVLNRIKNENSPNRKALIKVTNRVNESKDDNISHQKIIKALEEAGIPCVAINGDNPFDKKTYDEAVVVVTGQLGNRTMNFPDIYIQYYSFGKNATEPTIIQGLRCCGYREERPILRIPASLEKKLRQSIEIENNLYNEQRGWLQTDPDIRSIVHPRSLKIIADKIVNVVTETFVAGLECVLDEEEYIGILKELYPLIDRINKNQKKGTRVYQNRSNRTVMRDTVNVFSPARIQPTRNLFLPNADWDWPGKDETGDTINMCVYYKPGMLKVATYYIDLDTRERKIALWDVKETENDLVRTVCRDK